RLCELNIHRGNTVVQVTLAYEARQSEVFQGQTPYIPETADPARASTQV
ncbi:Hok/Gef family protein, partial [Escherichia coli]